MLLNIKIENDFVVTAFLSKKNIFIFQTFLANDTDKHNLNCQLVIIINDHIISA